MSRDTHLPVVPAETTTRDIHPPVVPAGTVPAGIVPAGTVSPQDIPRSFRQGLPEPSGQGVGPAGRIPSPNAAERFRAPGPLASDAPRGQSALRFRHPRGAASRWVHPRGDGVPSDNRCASYVGASYELYRAIVTRYDKLKRNDESMLALACGFLWLPM